MSSLLLRKPYGALLNARVCSVLTFRLGKQCLGLGHSLAVAFYFAVAASYAGAEPAEYVLQGLDQFRNVAVAHALRHFHFIAAEFGGGGAEGVSCAFFLFGFVVQARGGESRLYVLESEMGLQVQQVRNQIARVR